MKVVKANAVGLSMKNKKTREGAVSLGERSWRYGGG